MIRRPKVKQAAESAKRTSGFAAWRDAKMANPVFAAYAADAKQLIQSIDARVQAVLSGTQETDGSAKAMIAQRFTAADIQERALGLQEELDIMGLSDIRNAQVIDVQLFRYIGFDFELRDEPYTNAEVLARREKRLEEIAILRAHDEIPDTTPIFPQGESKYIVDNIAYNFHDTPLHQHFMRHRRYYWVMGKGDIRYQPNAGEWSKCESKADIRTRREAAAEADRCPACGEYNTEPGWCYPCAQSYED